MKSSMELVVIDDEVRITESLAREIRLEFGEKTFDISKFTDPIEALTHIESNHDRIFLLISDLRMPKIKGSELIAQVHNTFPHIQTMLLTAYTDMEDIQKAIDESIIALLMKPWAHETLVYEVRRAMALYNLRKENETLRKRLDEMLLAAGAFQAHVFTHSIPPLEGIETEVSYEPYAPYHCGGDFYQISEIHPGKTLILLGDTTGHGYYAALVSMMFGTAIRILLSTNPDLKKDLSLLMTQLNTLANSCICFHSPGTLIGLTGIKVDIPAGHMEVITAGMPPVLYLGKDTQEPIQTTYPMLGVQSDLLFKPAIQRISKDDRVILFTDGLIESAELGANISPYKIVELALRNATGSVEALKETFKEVLPGKQFTDDVTILSIRIR